MTNLSISFAVCEVFAVPIAISIDRDDDDGHSAFIIHIGPIALSFEWWRT